MSRPRHADAVFMLLQHHMAHTLHAAASGRASLYSLSGNAAAAKRATLAVLQQRGQFWPVSITDPGCMHSFWAAAYMTCVVEAAFSGQLATSLKFSRQAEGQGTAASAP